MSTENRNNAKEKPLIKTSDGLVEGFYEEGVYKFYGIPYARPPVGKPPRRRLESESGL